MNHGNTDVTLFISGEDQASARGAILRVTFRGYEKTKWLLNGMNRRDT